MKVGILTFYYNNDNFGGQLQARALVKAIEDNLQISAEQIQYDEKRSWNKMAYGKRIMTSLYEAFSLGFNNGINYITKRFLVEKKKKENMELNSAIKSDLERRRDAFNRFFYNTAHSDEVYDKDSIASSVAHYDCFICGGDQIWNDWNDWFLFNSLDVFCLQFVPTDMMKISYAPSVPLQTIRSAFICRLTEYIQKLDAISVREKSSVHLLENKIRRRVEVVVDPVLLLTKEQWDKEKLDSGIKGKYLFCYLLGEGYETRQAVKNYASQVDCKLVTVPHIIEVNEWDVDFGDVQNYSAGPAEFIDLINNAEVVVTDSFHAAVFCMIYHKPFYVLERNTRVSGGSMGSRLTDFLIEYGLEKQKIAVEQLNSICEIPRIDYLEADNIHKRRSAESYGYLKRNLIKK